MNLTEKQKNQVEIDIRHKVMREIRDKKVRMRPAFVFVAQKLGLQSILALAIVTGALVLNIFLYFLKKTSVLKFLSFGWPGLKIVLMTLPYDYIVLFLIAIILANYIVHQLDLSRGLRMTANASAFALLVITVGIGAFFAVNGIENTIRGWSNNKIPSDAAVSGRVIESSDTEATIKEDNGDITEVILNKPDTSLSQYKAEYVKNKVLRAIGQRDKTDENKFLAVELSFCVV